MSDILKTNGFFKQYFAKVRSNISKKALKNFAQLSTDLERIKFVDSLNILNDLLWETPTKDLQEALKLKALGNQHFQKKCDLEALNCYNKALLAVPSDSSENLAVIFANRSAVLNLLKQYQFALADIDEALRLNYPKNLRYKLLERKAKCLLALKQHADALDAFKKTLTALSEANLPSERFQKMQLDIQIMISMLAKNSAKNQKKVFEPDNANKTRNDYLPALSGNINQMYPSASDAVKIVQNEEQGRFAIADKKITAGDTLLVEKAHCAVLLPEYALTHCQHCFLRIKFPIPCDGCMNIVYCSKNCKKLAECYHKFECAILPSIWKSGISIICHMALRLITQNHASFFDQFQKVNFEENLVNIPYKGSDYKRVLQLVKHETKRKVDDFFHMTTVALFLLRCLEKAKYISDKNDNYYIIGSLLLTHLQVLQFNAHEISELKMDSKFTHRADMAESIFVGGGLYPTLALFNHSCNPGVVRYFHGTSIITRSVTNIQPGETINENYGPIFTEMKRNDRQKKLKDQYWFDCKCLSCVQDWPILSDMDTKILRFRCTAQPFCPNIIPVHVDANEFLVKCGLCQQYTNILKGLKSLQETEDLFKMATKLLTNKENGTALAVFIQILGILDETLAPPFKDYHICQQGIRRCLLNYGNKFVDN